MRPLSESGRAAAEKLAKSLGAVKPTAIYSSPYRRAIETVESLARDLKLPIRTNADFRERTLGSIRDIPVEDAIAATFSDFDLTYPGGESSRSAQTRALRAIDRLRLAHPSGRIVISTHGNLLSLILHAHDRKLGFDFWRSLTLPDAFQLQHSGPGKASFERLTSCIT